MLPYIGPRGWVTERMVSELVKPLEAFVRSKPHSSAYESAWLMALNLGALGERASSAADVLEAIQEKAVEIRHVTGIASTLALARIDPKRQERAFRRLLKNPPQIEPRGATFWVPEWFYLLLDARVSKCLAKFMEDPDLKVAERAAEYLGVGGSAARDALPQLFQVIQGMADDRRRTVAVQAIARIADYTQLPKLEAVLKEEKSAKVRKELENSIRFIKYLQSE